MQAYTLTVGERLFRLRTPCDVTALSARLTAAVRQGGDMVSLPVAGEVSVSVLVSPGVYVVLETYEVDPRTDLDHPPGSDPAADLPWIAADDLDY